MQDYEKLLLEEYNQKVEDKVYLNRIAGDVSAFRYPHLEKLAGNFTFDKETSSFLLSSNVDETIQKISIEDITVYEMLDPKAKRLHLCDILGYKPTFQEKYEAYCSVRALYEANQKSGKWIYSLKISKKKPSKIAIRENFSSVTSFINKCSDTDIYMCQFTNTPAIFQFGSMLKGTNIAFTDACVSNFAQEFFHAIYHLEEGIPGFDDDNMNIEEVWATVPDLYLFQLVDGRIARRIRNNTSPHNIKFLDYIFMRAYLGQALVVTREIGTFAEEQYIFHPVFALIEPFIKLLLNSLKESNIERLNEYVVQGICFDNAEPIVSAFNKMYGMGAYEAVFYNFSLFDRLRVIREICQKNGQNIDQIYEIMFKSPELVRTPLSRETVEFIMLNPHINQDKSRVIDLLENSYEV